MRVLNVSVLLDPVTGGGTAERTFQMSRSLARAGIECAILTTDIGLTTDRIKQLGNVRVIALSCISKRFFVVRFSWSHLKALVDSVDVIHLMGHWSMLNVLVTLLARQTGTPYVVCPAGELSLFGRSSWQKKVFNLLIGYRIVREASGHIAVSPDEIPVYECYGVEQSKITVIPNGINETDFAEYGANQFADRFGLRAAPFILFMGRLNPIKGPDLLLEAFCTIAHKHPERDLVFAGPDGGLLGALEKVTRARGVADRVSFIGYVAGRDKAEAYRAADLLVIPSRQEAMSIVVLEAGIVGTPVLLTDRCGFDEVAKVGGGKVVAATAIDLAAGLDSLLADRSALKGMGEHLQAHVRENFTWDVIVRRFMDLYQQLLARPGRGHAINQ
jgi:glycosyltransferase involved in cell wall biosynthesis